jgi:hypothetical protein
MAKVEETVTVKDPTVTWPGPVPQMNAERVPVQQAGTLQGHEQQDQEQEQEQALRRRRKVLSWTAPEVVMK